MFEYKNLSIGFAVLCGVLSFLLFLFPDFILWLFAVDTSEGARFISRRAGILFLGLGVISYASRNADHSVARQAICLGVAVCMILMAILGLFEFVRGFSGIGSFAPIVIEVFFAFGFFQVWRKNRIGV
jgi:hypothetical protein